MVVVSVEVGPELAIATNDITRLRASGATLGEALAELLGRHPPLRVHLIANDGSLREQVRIFVNEEHVAYERGAGPALREADRIHVLLVHSD